MSATSCSGVLPRTKLFDSNLCKSNHRVPTSCSYTRSLKSVSCHLSEGLRDPNKSSSKEIVVSCSSSSDKGSSLVGRSHHCGPIEKRNTVGQTFCSAGVSTYSGAQIESDSHAMEEKIGVLLLNLGGPETLDDVQPFLFNLFADPVCYSIGFACLIVPASKVVDFLGPNGSFLALNQDIIRLPRLFQFLRQPLAKLISVFRAPKSKEGYAAIGGGSPLRKITDEQAHALKMALEAKNMPVNVYVGMRYWYPFTEEAIQQIKKDRITKLVVLPLYPQFSISTTGSSLGVLQKIFREDAYLSELPVSIINSWYQREGYIKSMADLIGKELKSFLKTEEVMILFSAHGVPVSYVEDAGDPYKDQMEECIYLIMQELKARGINNEHTLCYQSRVGPIQWLKPYTDEVLVELGQKGVKNLLAVPVSFVSEHIETLEEIDMEYKHLALESGIENWGRVPALGCTSTFIMDLADAVIEALPSATAISTSRSVSKAVDNDPMQYIIKMFFGSILAVFLLLSPKMVKAFKNNLF